MASSALSHRNFRLIWSGLLVSNAGTWMQTVAQSWHIYKMTGNDPMYLGWLGLAFAIPMVVLPPLGGVVVDRVDRVRLLYITQSSSMALAVILAALTWTSLLRPWHILASTLLGAVLLAFDSPARQSMIPGLVPREALQNALSLNAATFTSAALVGPALAGVLLDVLGAGWLFFLNALSYLAVLSALSALRDVPCREGALPPLREALLGGFAYVRQERWLIRLLALSAVGSIFARSYQQLLAVFADDVFHAGARGFGVLLAAGGVGALLGAIGLSSLKDIAHKERVLIGAGAALAVALAAFSLVRRFPLGAALVVVIGVATTAFTTMTAAMIQLRVPEPLRGRVVSLYVSTLIGFPSLGALLAAAVAKRAGAPHALLYAAVAFAIALAISAPAHLRARRA